MEMPAASRTIAVGALVLALLGAGVALLFRGGSEPAPPATAAPEPPVPPADSDAEPVKARGAQNGRELTLPEGGEGTPLVWVRNHEQVDIHSTPGGPVVKTVGDATQFGSRTILSVAKKDGEWAGVPNAYTGNGTLGWVRLDPDELHVSYTDHAIVIDLSDHRAQLLRHGKTIRSFTVSIGAPGAETPTGEFAVTDTFRGGLNPVYGCCAVALTAVQPNLPSGWIGGDRIAIHGTTGPLGVNISHGCVRAADRDVSALVTDVPPGAPVTIRE